MRVIAPEELLPDGVHILTFTIPGQPYTKKNSMMIVRGRLLPSKQSRAYEAHCLPLCRAVWADLGHQPMDFGVSVGMRVWLKSWVVGDTCGYSQAVCDALERGGVLANDSWVHLSGDSHWLAGIDPDNPRVEIVISRLRHPKEQFRADQIAAEEAKAARKVARELKAAKIV